MVLGQLYLPRRVGVASGLTVGLSMGSAGSPPSSSASSQPPSTSLRLPRGGRPRCWRSGRPSCRRPPARANGRADAGRDRAAPIERSVNEAYDDTEFFARCQAGRPGEGGRDEQHLRLRRRGRRAVDRGRRRREGERQRGASADCTIAASEETLVKIAKGEAGGDRLHDGKLKISGDMGAALKLRSCSDCPQDRNRRADSYRGSPHEAGHSLKALAVAVATTAKRRRDGSSPGRAARPASRGSLPACRGWSQRSSSGGSTSSG